MTMGLCNQVPQCFSGEAGKLEIRAESSHAFNSPQFAPPRSTKEPRSLGRVLSQINSPRQIQLGLKA